MTAVLPPVVEVAAGQLHSIARTESGDVWGWGYNTNGQVGDGSVLPANTGRLVPAQLDVHGITHIAAGGVQNLALGADGSVWVWGANRYGTCGTGSRVDARVPTRVTRVDHGVAISMGAQHALLLARGRAPLAPVATGSNDHGQLGDATSERRLSPRAIPGAGALLGAAAGAQHSLLVSSDHRLWVWGDNSYGQLGLSGGDRGAPQELTLPLEPDVAVASVAAGDRHSLVLTSDGKVWAFGDDSLGQLGDGSSSARHEAAIVPGLSAVSAIAAGSAFNLALRDDGTVWTWGSNACGEVGQAPSEGRLASPKQVSSLGGVTAIAAGACHAVVLTSRGTLEVWGANDRGQLGLGAPSGRVTKPTEVSLLDDVVTIAAGAFHTLALRSDGSIWGFGDDSAGQLGGTAGQGAVPRRLTSESAADLIAAGFSHSLYASFPGEVHAWGLGRAGQLGVGDGRDYFDAQRVDIGGVRWLTAGGSHTLFGVELPP